MKIGRRVYHLPTGTLLEYLGNFSRHKVRVRHPRGTVLLVNRVEIGNKPRVCPSSEGILAAIAKCPTLLTIPKKLPPESLVAMMLSTESKRVTAKRFGVSRSTVQRYRALLNG